MGATTIAVNLAACLKELEGVESVAIVDMNPVLGEVPFFLNVDVNGFDWLDVSKNISRVDATYLMSILLKHPSGIRILPPPTSMIDDHEQIARSMGILFTKMQHMFDFTVVDIGKSINAVSTTVLKMSDRIVIAVQMSLSCLIGVKRIREALQGFDNLNGDGIDVVVNRYQKNSLFTLKEAEESLKKKILWTIPNDYKTVFSAINQGKPLNLAAGGTEISKNFTELASMISEKRGKTERKKTGLFGLRSFA